MRNATFEDFLQDKHAAQYQGLDDEMGEDYEEWLSELDIDTLLRYAQNYADKKYVAGLKACAKLILEL